MLRRLPLFVGMLLMAIAVHAIPSSKFALTVTFYDGHQRNYPLSDQPKLLWENDSIFISTPQVRIGMKHKELRSLSFTPNTVEKGDVNGDGMTDTQDVLSIYDYMQNGESSYATSALDVNGDGSIDTQDVLLIYDQMRMAAIKRRGATASGIDQMVVVTSEGDLFAYNLSDAPTLVRDNVTDSLTLTTKNETLEFLPYGITQIYFEDKAIVDQDPYIAPKAGDYVNPNLITQDSLSYVVTELDTLIGRATIRFEKEIPQMYVGQIYIARNDTIGLGMYILTFDRLNDHDVVVRFRPAMFTEMLYNCIVTLSSTPEAPYFTKDSVQLDETGAATPKRAYRIALFDWLDVDYGNDAHPKIDFYKSLYNVFESSSLAFDPSIKPSFDTDFQFVTGEPITDEGFVRRIQSKVELFQFVMRGGLDCEEKVKVDVHGSLTGGLFGIKLPYDWEVLRITKLPWIPFIHGVPVFLHVEPAIRAFADAVINGELIYAQTLRQSVRAEVGVRYEGKANKLKPIFKITPTLRNDPPKVSGASLDVTLYASVYPRINCMMYKVLDIYLDLMPVYIVKASANWIHGKEFPQIQGDFEFRVRLGAKVETSRPIRHQGQKDWLKKRQDDAALTFTPFKRNIFKFPTKVVDMDSAKVLYAGYKVKHELKYGVQAVVQDVIEGTTKKKEVKANEGKVAAVAHQNYSNFSSKLAAEMPLDNSYLDEMNQVIDVGGNVNMIKARMPENIRRRMPNFPASKTRYDLVAQMPKPAKAPLRMTFRDPDLGIETGIGGLAEGLIKAGEAWATQCDDDAVAQMSHDWNTPIGYTNVLRTSILNAKGKPIMSIDREMPWEIKNFDASWSATGGGHGTIEYRNGGENVTEVVVGADGSVKFIYSRSSGTTTVIAAGMSATLPQRMLPGTSCMASPDIIIPGNEMFSFKGFCSAWDMMYWQAENLERNPYAGQATFGTVEYLGYPCKYIKTSEGTIYFWQNLNLYATGEATFKVTSLKILDDPDNPTVTVEHEVEEEE